MINGIGNRVDEIEIDIDRVSQRDQRLLELQVEKVAYRHFWCLKALNLNLKQGGQLTGWLGWFAGYIVGNIAAREDEREESVEMTCAAGYFITSIPGKIAGLATVPPRMISMCNGRDIDYLSTEVETVIERLRSLEPNLKRHDEGQVSEESENFKQSIDKITQMYKDCSSKSSKILWDILRYETNLRFISGEIVKYLSETEIPIQFLSLQAKSCSKNQGKKLFNCIMKEFST